MKTAPKVTNWHILAATAVLAILLTFLWMRFILPQPPQVPARISQGSRAMKYDPNSLGSGGPASLDQIDHKPR